MAVRLPQFRLTQTLVYNAGITASILLSVGGVVRGAFFSKNCLDGQRGGALGVAAAFAILFLSRNYGQRVYESILDIDSSLSQHITSLVNDEQAQEFTNAELTRIIISILGRINVTADEQRRQNIALAVASVISTIVWGFGDVFVGWISSCRQ